MQGRGEMAEWLKAAVLKTADGAESSVGSNPTLSWISEESLCHGISSKCVCQWHTPDVWMHVFRPEAPCRDQHRSLSAFSPRASSRKAFVSHGRAAASGNCGRLGRRGIRFVVDRAYRSVDLIAHEESKSEANARGVKMLTTHGLRASYITVAPEAGATIQDVAVDVGHADVRTTARYQDRKHRRERNTAHRTHGLLASRSSISPQQATYAACVSRPARRSSRFRAACTSGAKSAHRSALQNTQAQACYVAPVSKLKRDLHALKFKLCQHVNFEIEVHRNVARHLSFGTSCAPP